MNIRRTLFFLAAVSLVVCSALGYQTVKLSFSQTDVSQVFKAISLSTGANIVVSVTDKLPVTVNISAPTTEEAIKSVASAAGLAYRRVGNTFVIAKPDGLKNALSPYCYRVKFEVRLINADDAAKKLEAALPQVTALPSVSKVVVIALPEDIVACRELLADLEHNAKLDQSETSVVTLVNATPSEVAASLKAAYPQAKISLLGKGESAGGVLTISGPRTIVESCLSMASNLDIRSADVAVDEILEIYNAKYASPVVLKEFIELAIPSLKAIIGPETYTPMQPQFRTLIGNSLAQGNNQSGSGSSGSQGGAGTSSLSSGAGGSSGGVAQPYQKAKEGDRAKTLVLKGSAAEIKKALGLLEKLDVKPQQVRVEVKVVDTSPEISSEYGLSYSWSTFKFIEGSSGTTVADAFKTTRPAGFGQISRVPWDFSAVLSALVTKKEAKILASPSMAVIDNDDANIFIGDTIRARISQATGLGAQTVEIVEFPVGIILMFRPRVNADGNITMRVHPIVSTITDIDSDNVPQTSSREAETTVMVKDGETVVIGGLIRNELNKTIKELPFISQIPILGELFRNRSTSQRKSEILVFITTTIVKDRDEKATGSSK